LSGHEVISSEDGSVQLVLGSLVAEFALLEFLGDSVTNAYLWSSSSDLNLLNSLLDSLDDLGDLLVNHSSLLLSDGSSLGDRCGACLHLSLESEDLSLIVVLGDVLQSELLFEDLSVLGVLN